MKVAMEALRVGISFSPGIGNKAILPRNIMRIPAMSRILRSSNLYGKIIVFEYNISFLDYGIKLRHGFSISSR